MKNSPYLDRPLRSEREARMAILDPHHRPNGWYSETHGEWEDTLTNAQNETLDVICKASRLVDEAIKLLNLDDDLKPLNLGAWLDDAFDSVKADFITACHPTDEDAARDYIHRYGKD